MRKQITAAAVSIVSD